MDGTWPAYYLAEALYLAAVVEFGLENEETCEQFVTSYFDLASVANGSNRADAILLRLWACLERPPNPLLSIKSSPNFESLCKRRGMGTHSHSHVILGSEYKFTGALEFKKKTRW